MGTAKLDAELTMRSADELPKTEDFTGKVDGGGIKAVMFVPKNPLELIAPQFLLAIGRVLDHGKRKYAANNWMRGMSWTTVFGGILRHLFSFACGEEIDTDSGEPHLAHAACGLMFLFFYAHVRRRLYEEYDDRVFKDE